jgi:hypothetical protein
VEQPHPGEGSAHPHARNRAFVLITVHLFILGLALGLHLIINPPGAQRLAIGKRWVRILSAYLDGVGHG